MAVSPRTKTFPPRKRRPPATSFLSPTLSVDDLIRSLRSISADLSSLHPTPSPPLLRRHAAILIRKCSLLSLLFDDVSRNIPFLSHSTSSESASLLCFEELYVLFQRIAALLEDSSSSSDGTGSKTWLLIQTQSFAESFRELNSDLLTLLEILRGKDLILTQDVDEILNFLIKQCRQDKDYDTSFLDPRPADHDLGIQLLRMLASIKRAIAPDHSELARIFAELSLTDSSTCTEEIELLHYEAQCQGGDDKSRSDLIELIGLVRYARCVLYAASSSRSPDSSLLQRRTTASEANVPSDFRCPITLELMRDPVVVATGQTYDRSSIAAWIGTGHNTCPKTGQLLSHTNLIPNRALKNLIAMWCRDQRISYPEALFATVETYAGDGRGVRGGGGNINCKAPLEATKMTVAFLVDKLSSLSADYLDNIPPHDYDEPSSKYSSLASPSCSGSSASSQLTTDAVDRVVYELRALAKTDSDTRAVIGESAAAIPLLVRHLGSSDPSLQVNAVTTLLNLSILDDNKPRIMETEGAVTGVIEVLRSGTTWEAKGNAAATLFSLAAVSAYRKRLAKKTRVLTGLLDLARGGSASSKKDALVTIVSLAGDKETVGMMLEMGAVEAVAEGMEELPEETTVALETVVKRGGMVAVEKVAETRGLIGRIAAVLRTGSGKGKESAAATLVTVCRRGGSKMVEEVATAEGVEAAVWDLMGNGTPRAKRKAGSLMRYLQRWAAGLVEGESYASNASATANANAHANDGADVAGLLDRVSLSMSLP